jgi:hypothetical protein
LSRGGRGPADEDFGGHSPSARLCAAKGAARGDAADGSGQAHHGVSAAQAPRWQTREIVFGRGVIQYASGVWPLGAILRLLDAVQDIEKAAIIRRTPNSPVLVFATGKRTQP